MRRKTRIEDSRSVLSQGATRGEVWNVCRWLTRSICTLSKSEVLKSRTASTTAEGEKSHQDSYGMHGPAHINMVSDLNCRHATLCNPVSVSLSPFFAGLHEGFGGKCLQQHRQRGPTEILGSVRYSHHHVPAEPGAKIVMALWANPSKSPV